eukprot:1154913-Pelagomonas_calceolata.AAC.2
MFTPKIKDWREITYTDGSVIKHKGDGFLLLSGSGVYKPGRETSPSYQHLQLHIKTNGHGPTNTINRAELAGSLVALQQGKTGIASDGASCLSNFKTNPKSDAYEEPSTRRAHSCYINHAMRGLTPVLAPQPSQTSHKPIFVSTKQNLMLALL